MTSKLNQKNALFALVFVGASLAAATPALAHATHQDSRQVVVVASAPTHLVVTRNAQMSPYEGKLLRIDGQWWTLIDDSFYRVRLLGAQWLLLDAAYMPLAHLRLARSYGFYSTAGAINLHSRTPRVVYLERHYQTTVTRQWRQWQQTRRHDTREPARVAMREQRDERNNARGNGNAFGQGNGRGNANGRDDNRGSGQGRGNGNARGRN